MGIDRNKFDAEERQIYAAFSQIKVNHTGLAARVKCRMGASVPTRRLGVRGGPLLAVALVLLLVSTAALAVGLYGFERFIERFNPPFAEIVEPVGAYSEDQGIRMTVIGAQQFGNMAVVYLSVQDVSGENRLTETMSFLDGLWVGSPEAGSSSRRTLLDFDAATNTAYFEIQVTVTTQMEGAFEIGASRIFLETYMFWDEPVDLPLGDLGVASTTQFPQGGLVLTPGYFAPMPHGDPLQWISNVGIVDGRLHIQVGGCYGTRHQGLGPGDASFSLVTPAGVIIWPTRELVLLGADLGFTTREEAWANSEQLPAYHNVEFIFEVDLHRLSDYTLLYSGQASRGITGNWRVAVDTSDTAQQFIVLTNDIPVEGIMFEFVALSPLGLDARGRLTDSDAGFIPVEIETVDGLIPLGYGSGMVYGQHFSFSWMMDVPLDLETVTAVIIDGFRVPVA